MYGAVSQQSALPDTRAWLEQSVSSQHCLTHVHVWSRVIDELRCTMVDKCNEHYIEVGLEKDWINYHW